MPHRWTLPCSGPPSLTISSMATSQLKTSSVVENRTSKVAGREAFKPAHRSTSTACSVGAVGPYPRMDFVHLSLRRNRGWPWPEDSWGLDSMYGETGWCHSCGTPLHEQSGSLTLQAGGQSPAPRAGVAHPRVHADF